MNSSNSVSKVNSISCTYNSGAGYIIIIASERNMYSIIERKNYIIFTAIFYTHTLYILIMYFLSYYIYYMFFSAFGCTVRAGIQYSSTKVSIV